MEIKDRNLELIKKYRDGESDAGGELAEINSPLVYSIASRFRSRYPDFDELIEAGNIGLVKAINTFDFSKGCVFSTYATPLIFGEIRRFLRDDGAVKVSREQKRLSALLGAERERRRCAGEKCDIASIAAAVGVSVQDASSAFFAVTPPRSLDEPLGADDEVHTLADAVFDDGAQESDFEKLSVRLALEKLGEFQRKLIILRFFRDMSQVEVARILGMSQVKVSREEKKILATLRKELS